MNILLRKDIHPSTNWLARLGIALALAFTMTVLLAGTALASGGGNFGGGTGDDSTPTNPGSGGGTGDTPGGGGALKPPRIVWYTYSSYQSADNISTTSLCAATNSRGDAVLGRKTTYRYPSTVPLGTVYAAIQAGSDSALARDNKVRKVSSGYGCLYPPAPSYSTLKVIVGSEATVRKIVPDSKVLKTASMQTRWGKGDHSVASARASTKSRADAYINIEEFGRYEATARTTAVNVRIASYNGAKNPVTGASIPDRIVSISNPYTSDASSSQGELTCAGWSNKWTGGQKSWSHADCGPYSTGTQQIYQCEASGQTTINGVATRSATLFRSGDPVPVQFRSVKPTGLKDLTAPRTRWLREENGTPWRESGVNVRNANFKLSLQKKGTQLFTSDTATNWNAGHLGGRDVWAHGYWATHSGLPTVLTPSYSFQGVATIASVRVTGLDSNGQWVTESTQRDVRALAICHGESISLEYVRSVAGG